MQSVQTVLIGKHRFEFPANSFKEYISATEAADVFRRDFANRVRWYNHDRQRFEQIEDLKMQVRNDSDGNQYVEFASPTNGWMTKRVSLTRDNKDKPNDGYFIAFLTPWIQYNRDEEYSEALYDIHQLTHDASKNGKGELKELGFTLDDAGVWVPVERVKIKTKANPKPHEVWRPL